MNTEAAKNKACRVSHQAGDPGKNPRSSSSQNAICRQNYFLLRLPEPFVLLRPSADCMRPIHIRVSKIFFPKSINLNVNLIWGEKITFMEISRIMFDQIYGYCGPIMLTHKIKHHTR